LDYYRSYPLFMRKLNNNQAGRVADDDWPGLPSNPRIGHAGDEAYRSYPNLAVAIEEAVRKGVLVDERLQKEHLLREKLEGVEPFRKYDHISDCLGIDFVDGWERYPMKVRRDIKTVEWRGHPSSFECTIHRRDTDPLILHFGDIRSNESSPPTCFSPGPSSVLFNTFIELTTECLKESNGVALKGLECPDRSRRVMVTAAEVSFSFAELEYWDGFCPFSITLFQVASLLENCGYWLFSHAEANGYNHYAFTLSRIEFNFPELLEGVNHLDPGQKEEDLGIYIDKQWDGWKLETVYDRIARDILGMLEIENRKRWAGP